MPTECLHIAYGSHVRFATVVPYYLFTKKQAFEYLMGQMPRSDQNV